MKEKAESLGVKILYNTKLLSLLTKNKELGSPVVGAKVENKGKIINILAKGGVVLATGGFANSPELVAKYHPYLKGIKAYGSPLNTGDGIKAAVDIGANFIVVHSGFGMNMVSVGTQSNKSLGQPMVAVPLIVVNKQGERFTDETKGYLNANHIMVEKKWKKANWIFDSKTVKDFGENSSLKLLFNQEKIPSYSSLDELAKAQGIPPEALKETIEEYNKDVREGKDIFGKKRLLATIEEGPFYTREVEPRIYTSYSGLEINTDAEVLDVRSKAIPGLYAAGDVVGVLTWQTGLAGGGLSTIAAAVVYGRIAGAEAAKRLK